MTVPSPELGFIHRYVPGHVPAGDPATPTLLLLHGTGGDETDLLPLAAALAPGAALLSPRGRVLDRGMPRFFRRIAEGVFDQEDLQRRTVELADFIDGTSKRYGFERSRVVGVGLSNGANIAASLLLSHPLALAGALLFRPMVPFEPELPPRLPGVPVLIAAGEGDPLVPRRESERLARLLEHAGARVTLVWQPGGHALTPRDIAAGRQWLTQFGLSSLSPPDDSSQW